MAGGRHITPETLRNWVPWAEIDGALRPGTTTEDAQWIAEGLANLSSAQPVPVPTSDSTAMTVEIGADRSHMTPLTQAVMTIRNRARRTRS